MIVATSLQLYIVLPLYGTIESRLFRLGIPGRSPCPRDFHHEDPKVPGTVHQMAVLHRNSDPVAPRWPAGICWGVALP